MQPSEAQAFRELVQNVHSFYGKDASGFTIDVWWGAMRHFDLAAIREAFSRHCVNPDNGQFVPRPADIVRHLEGSTLDSAVLAWTKVDRAIQTVGTYATVAFDDALIHRVIDDMGGWPQLGTKPIDEWPFVAKEFQTRYRGYKSRRETPAYPRKLIGRFDAENTQHGFAEVTPMLIGDLTKATAVFKGGSDQPRLSVTPLNQLQIRDNRAA